MREVFLVYQEEKNNGFFVVKSLGITVIVALHDLNLATAYCYKLYVMHDGRIVSNGKPDEIFMADLIKEVYEMDAVIRKERNPIYNFFNKLNKGMIIWL